MAINTQAVSAATGVRGRGTPGAWERVRTMYARWQERERIRWELAQMTPRELADLGLNASDIEDVARGRYLRG